MRPVGDLEAGTCRRDEGVRYDVQGGNRLEKCEANEQPPSRHKNSTSYISALRAGHFRLFGAEVACAPLASVAKFQGKARVADGHTRNAEICAVSSV